MRPFWIVLCTVLMVVGSPARAWWPKGHGILTRAAVKALPQEAPAFLRSGEGMIAHCAVDPDIAKNLGTTYLERARHPTHYFHLERLKGHALPKSRYEFIPLCAELAVRPERVGILPYVVAEWTEQLALVFAEYRKWPDNPFIQSKCLMYAGFVAHYAQEVCQPLNLTVHWNGRIGPDGTSARTRIHEHIDSLIQDLNLDSDDLAQDQKVEPFDDLMAGIWQQVQTGHARVDRVYQLEESLPSAAEKEGEPVPEVVDFAVERAREAVRFTAALYLTAWELSGQIRVPGWIDREEIDRAYLR